MSETIAALARSVGILPEYVDTMGQNRAASDETLRALLAAMEVPAESDAEARETLEAHQAERRARPLPPWIVVTADTPATLPAAGTGRWRLIREDAGETAGDEIDGTLTLPGLPIGLHRLTGADWSTTLLAAPRQLPDAGRGWGITLPLYGLRSADQGGLGTYRDLEAAAAGLAGHGAGFVGINPVHAGFPADCSAYSPYSPSHRRRLNVAHVWAGDEAARPDGPLIDYPAALATRMAALEAGFATVSDTGTTDPDFARFLDREGASLARFATHQALSERFGAYWHLWPAEFQDPGSHQVRAFAAENARRLRFHCWLQWQAERQLGAASRAARDGGMAHGLYLDLAVGTHPHGAETWSNRHQFAQNVSLGAPPDAFSPAGQTWGLAPFNPLRLIAEGFRPFADTLRKQFQFARLLRIDHVLGFDRAFWVPEEAGLPGTYVQMPRAALLAVTRIEAARAGAQVVGEDLGNIPPGLQADLAASGILGCRVAMFERESDEPPRYRGGDAYTEAALASFATHDLPTWAGWRSGQDIAARHALALMGDGDAEAARAYRSREVAAFDTAAATGSGTAEDVHRFLARSAARLVALQIEDIFGIKDQANLPGTVEIHPNWRQRLPLGADALGDDPRLAQTARLMAENGR